MTYDEVMVQVYKYRNNPGMKIWKLNKKNGEWEQQKSSDLLSMLDRSDRVIAAYEKPDDLVEQLKDK